MNEDKLKHWVADDSHFHTQVEGPVLIDKVAQDDLAGYHPTAPDGGPESIFEFKLVRHSTVPEIAVVDVPDRNWHATFREVMQNLQFQVVEDSPIGMFLQDRGIATRVAIRMGTTRTWQVDEWKIVRTQVDPRTLQVLELMDVIEWVSDRGDRALSTYKWKPYILKRSSPRLLTELEYRTIGDRS